MNDFVLSNIRIFNSFFCQFDRTTFTLIIEGFQNLHKLINECAINALF